MRGSEISLNLPEMKRWTPLTRLSDTMQIKAIPFDVANVRTVSYETTLAGAEAAKKEISSMMESIERGDIVHNPVSEVGTMLNISENSMKESVICFTYGNSTDS